jgi:DNA primase small subunit
LSIVMGSSNPRITNNQSHVDDPTTAFLRRTYREYYFNHHDDVEIPTMIESREFGYIPFGKGMIRHLSYKTSGELAADLVKQAPSSVFCSNATYSNPTLPMDDKGWKGAGLIFDIDASAIPTSCRARHSYWVCKTCGKIIRSADRPAHCPKCEGIASTTQLHWSCAECLGATKDHVLRLINFLVVDFGVSSASSRVYFSGNRGYHLHVDDERFVGMDSQSRAEIANYIRGTGLFQFSPRSKGADRSSPSPVSAAADKSEGWFERMAAAGSTATTSFSPGKDIVATFASMIDESVTTDIHRIFRMPGTLHGSSGLLKTMVHDLASFRPDFDPVVLSNDEVTISVKGSPAFSLKGRAFGPYSSEEVTLPTYAAVYLLTKGLGMIVD